MHSIPIPLSWLEFRLGLDARARFRASAAKSALRHSVDILLPFDIDGAPVPDSRPSTVEWVRHPLRQQLARRASGNQMCNGGKIVAVVDYDGHQQTSRAAGSGLQAAGTLRGGLAVFRFGRPLVEVCGGGVAGQGDGDVRHEEGGFSPSTAWVVSAVTPRAECTVVA